MSNFIAKTISKVKKVLWGKFPKRITEVNFYYHNLFREDSQYCTDLRDGQSVSLGSIIPMLREGDEVAFYEVVDAYYTMGDSMSDWAIGDDGKDRDLKLHHIEKERDLDTDSNTNEKAS